uniref:ATP synthase subunit delta, chloroplastic n=1 Tax=Tolypiocladia glomerulata TaxID=860646 RepID=A0A1Z1MV49_9FLOR|nr:ATP synthase CF1 subunit delta [Tolypiocladia glomerulata]ARW69732.1 ATP synthase CF1 subunit delta [Tolypiocladia glomerulata]
MSTQNFGEKVATPYAEALIAKAQKVECLDQYKIDLSSILSVLLKSKDLQIFLVNPLNSNINKKSVLKKLFDGQINSFIMNFLLVLVDRRRISFLKSIIEKYLEITYLLESVTIVELYSVVDFSEDQQNDLINKIKLATKSNEIKLISKKDPSLIGGFIIKIGSKVIDASLVGKLNKISSYLNSK